MHHVALDPDERRRRSLRVCVNEPREESLGPAVAHPDGVRDGVHRAAAKERDVGHRVPVVDVQEARERHVAGAVAAADRQDVDVHPPEVFCDAVELLDRARRAEHPVVAEAAREAQRGARVAQVAPALGV